MRLNQSASAVWMVRPAAFYGNPETAASNAFQQVVEAVPMTVVLQEFDSAVEILQDAGIEVIVTQSVDEEAPDALFPNNWISYHHNGTVVFYPMLAPSRRRERSLGIPREVKDRFVMNEVLDLIASELQQKYLEGTGSIVFDHHQRCAYAVRSARTHEEVLQTLCTELNYTPVLFSAMDKNKVPVYHTNVVMNIGEEFAVICAEAIADLEERKRICNSLQESGRRLLRIDLNQMHSFAGNMLSLCTNKNEKLLLMSSTAYSSLSDQQLHFLREYVRILTVDIPVIEKQGGGSIRCMLSEIFLPKK